MGEKSGMDKYRERQRHRGTKRAQAARRLALIAALVIGTLIFELLILGFSADKTSWQTALIWSGFLWIGLGGLLGAGMADTATVANMNPAASPITARELSRDRLNERDKQLGTMLTMEAVGAVLLLLYLILTYVL
jgi:hypothetical protein